MKSGDNFRLLLLQLKIFVLEGKYYIIFVIQVIVYTVYTVLISILYILIVIQIMDLLPKRNWWIVMDWKFKHPFTKVVTTYKFRTYLIRFNGIFGQWVYLNQQKHRVTYSKWFSERRTKRRRITAGDHLRFLRFRQREYLQSLLSATTRIG